MIKRFKAWAGRQWVRLKKWGYGILVALGLVAAPLLYAEIVGFTYTAPTSYTDGTPLPIDEIQETRLYCDGSLVASEPGADGDIDAELGIGSHECYATVVDIYGRESGPSNTVTRVVDPPGTGPSPPIIDDP